MYLIRFLSLIVTCLVMTNTFATEHYKHIPFKLHMAGRDKVIVNYDFAGQKGITCTANTKQAIGHFIYKGFEKSAHLPFILENARVPSNKLENLADVKGQFNITLAHNDTNLYTIDCDYVDHK